MLADSFIVPECIYQPGSFSGLMTLYESSYLKFQHLCNKPLQELRDVVSTTEHDCDLHLNILRKEPYTSTARLTYWFTEGFTEGFKDGLQDELAEDLQMRPATSNRTPSSHALAADPVNAIADPDLTFRIYHDARLVEVVSLSLIHRHCKLQELDQSHAEELDRRWKRNMLLNKWLDYLMDVGHSFT